MAVPILMSMNERFDRHSNQTEYPTDPYGSFLSKYLTSKPNYRRLSGRPLMILDIPAGHSGASTVMVRLFFMPVKLDKKISSDAICWLCGCLR